MRIVASNPDAIGDFIIRQPFYAALHHAGHELFLIVRPHVLPFVSHVAPFAKAIALPADPYQTDVAANWHLYAALVEKIESFNPELIVLASYYWTAFDERFATQFNTIPIAGMSGRHTGMPPPKGLLSPGGRAFTPLVQVDEQLPELEKYQVLARAILKTEIAPSDPIMSMTPADENAARLELFSLGLKPNDYCIVCVGGTTNVTIKTWPAERWASVLSSWMNKHGARILFTGLRSEEPAIDATRALMSGSAARTFKWIDDTGSKIETLLGLIGLSNGYIGHDTGPMHMAAAMKKPVFALFGGGHWGRFLPSSPATRVLTAKVPCAGCGWNCPYEKAYCVQSVSTDDVLAALNDLTASTTPRRDVRTLELAPDIASTMLAESAKIAVRERRDLYVSNSLLAQRDAELAVVKTHLSSVAQNAEASRLAATGAEAALRRIDDMTWYKRVRDTVRRIGKIAIFGRRYVRKPEERPLPTITVVTPVFNCAGYIRDTLESVLNQNYPNLEFIVVDGGSTDGTLQILNEYKDRITHIISEPDNGMYDAIGKGFDASKGEILAYLNADDMYEPGGLLRIGAWFRDHPDADVAYHENTVASNGWRFANVAQPSVGMYDLLKGHILFQDGVFFRRKAYTAIGGVNRALRRAGDYALWLEMSLWFKFHRVPGHISSFRVRSGQISANMEAYEQEQATARDKFSKHLTMKRALWRLPGRISNGVSNYIESKFRNRELFYPVDFPNMPPPPCDEPSLRAPLPVCPLSGAPPDRLLLSARHPMLLELDMQRMYLCETSRIAINHPAPSGVQWKRLRSNRFAVPPVDWSNPPAGVAAPAAPYASPYSKSKMGGTVCERVLRRAACKVLRPNNDFLSATSAVHRNAVTMLTQVFDTNDTRVRFLDVAALDGGMLDAVASGTKWQRVGVESDPELAAVAHNRGHSIIECSDAEAACVIPADERFHIVHLGALLPYLPNPIKTINALKNLLTPGGVLVMGSPNLDSKQQEWFGPAWAHWHLTRWHALYSRQAFEELARLSNMDIIRSGSFSHAEWTAFGMHFQAHGLAWSVPEISAIPESAFQHAGRIQRFVSNQWDYSGRGDWITAVLKSK